MNFTSSTAFTLTVLCIPYLASAQDMEGAESEQPVSQIEEAQQDAVYQRPFIVGGHHAAIGGYAEGSLGFRGEEGVDEGPSFEFRRFNLFVFSQIGSHVRFVSELEFEHGTEEIVLETAHIDVEVVPEFALRAGILLSPLGAFNQDHDAPGWDFVERPLVSTTIIPGTFSEVGVGAHGTVIAGPVDLDYQLYVTQGLADGVLDNDMGRTSIPDGRSQALFEEDNNNSPAVTGRVAMRQGGVLEMGLSGWRGAYNTFEVEGETVDEARPLTIGAVDARLTTEWVEVRGEVAYAWIDVPESLDTTFGDKQWGVHVDVVSPIWRFALWGSENASLNLGVRYEHVDYNETTLASTGVTGGDYVNSLSSAISFRPSSDTVFRLNYSRSWTVDLFNNAAARGAALQVGMATYF